jgi:hypothetical protein
MVAFVGLLGALQILGGIAVFVWAPSAIQEILGAVMFGMGVIAFALGALLEKATKQLKIFEKLGQPKL